MIEPLGHRLLVKPEKIEDIDPAIKSARSLGIVIEGDEMKREQAAVDRGVVVSMGKTAFVDFGGTPWCQVGDKIAYTRYGGKMVKDPDDGQEYIILNDEDVICRYAEKESNDK